MNIPVTDTFDATVERLVRHRERNATVDLKEAGLGQRDALLTVADDARLWRCPEGQTYATIYVDGHEEHLAIVSRAFKDWWLSEFAMRYTVNGRPASVGEAAYRDAKQSLEARAAVTRIKHDAPLRVVEHQDATYIDLGSEDWSAVEVTPEGWSVVEAPPVPLVRTRRTGAMPMPVRGDFGPLQRLLGRLDPADFILFTAWCLQALAPSGPYPVLIVGGEAGAGKTTMARLAQKITDPVNGDVLQPPGNDRDLIAAARQGRVLVFDNISSVKPDIADSICRLSTGAEIGGRALFTDHDSASFSACRPVVLNGIPDLAARGDLADRAIVIRLTALEERVSERDWAQMVEEAIPPTFGALLTALSVGLSRLSTTPTPSLRMADFARLVIAAEPALPWAAGDFLAAYHANRARAVVSIVEGDLVATKVRTFADQHASGWAGLMSELYTSLTETVTLEAKRSGDWPGNPRWFSDRLTRAAPALRAIGISVTTKQENRGTTARIEKIAPLAPLAPRTGATGGASGSNGAISHIPEEPEAWGQGGYLK